MDTRLEALLASVRAAPADDMPRLVLADELQRRGDPWGKIVVMSCRLAALDADSTEARKLRLWIHSLCRRRWPALDARSTIELDLARTRVGPEAAHALVRSTLSPTLRMIIRVQDREAPYVRALAERFADVMAL